MAGPFQVGKAARREGFAPRRHLPGKIAEPGWEPYGGIAYLKHRREPIFLYRRGQRCRWLTAAGVQVGPEQPNVAPAIAWAHRSGYRSSR